MPETLPAGPRRPRPARAGARQRDRQRAPVLARRSRCRGSTAGAVDGYVDVRVVDRGPGVPGATASACSSPSSASATRAGDGVGLGLAVAKGFVEAMGGEIEVEDTRAAG